MRRFVTVEWGGTTSGWREGERRPVLPVPVALSVPALALTVRAAVGSSGSSSEADRGRVLLARTGVPDVRMVPYFDEHLAVDADADRAARWLDCADVLQTSRPRPAADASRWLADIRAAHPACRLAAAPLAGGGWSVSGGDDPGAVVLPCRTPPERSLFPSCLHGWLVAGRSLRELASARLSWSVIRG